MNYNESPIHSLMNQEVSTPPTTETIKSTTTYDTSSYDSDIDELEHEILNLSDRGSPNRNFSDDKNNFLPDGRVRAHIINDDSTPSNSKSVKHKKKNKFAKISKNNMKRGRGNKEINQVNHDDTSSCDESNDHNQNHALKSQAYQKELLIEKGKKLCEIILDSPNNSTKEIQRMSYNSSEISNTLNAMNKEPIAISDINSAKNRILQWYNQGTRCDLIQDEIHRYKLYHLKILYDIYNELVSLGQKLNLDKDTEIGNIKSWVTSTVINTLKVSERTERRYRSGCTRLQQLLDNGITYQQLVKAGCTPTTFYVDTSDYSLFLSQLPSNIKSSNNARLSALSNFTDISSSKSIDKRNNEAHLITSSDKNAGSNNRAICDSEIIIDGNSRGLDYFLYTLILLIKILKLNLIYRQKNG
jgi:hypothetical protein